MNRLFLLLGLWFGSLSANGQLDAVRYWFDNGFATRTNFILNPSNNLSYSREIDVSALPDGLHTLHIQFREDTIWTSVSSDIFFKITATASGSAVMQYWFDNQFENAKTINLSNTKNIALITNISVSGLSYGLHTLHTRFRPQGKEWTSVASDIIFTGMQKAGSEIVEFKYWYNHDSLSAKTIQVGNSTEFFFDIDIEGLTNGKHVFNGQFKDAKGRWTAVEKDTIQVGPIELKNHLFPTITLSSASLGIGSTLTVSGSQFTLNGKVNMRIYPASGNGLILDSVVFAEYNGTVRMDYALPTQLIKGDYIVSATDANTGRNTDARRFFVNGMIADNTGSISVQTPVAGQKYMLGNGIIVLWRDKADYGYLIPGTGALNIRYKIEVQKDNGAWQTAKDTIVKGFKDQFSTFAYVHRPPAVGSYAFRITNQETSNRVGVSGTGIVENQQGGVNVEFVWDYTVPDRENKNVTSPPIGVAADGTARFYIKVGSQAGNTKTIRNVEVKLRDPNRVSYTPEELGRVMWARGIYDYSLEGNDAREITANSAGASDNQGGHWFWYVAPDDFARHEVEFYKRSRKVIASIVVWFTDGTRQLLPIEREIEIVRPPVMFVHGLGGNKDAWDNFRFTKNQNNKSTKELFTDADKEDGPFSKVTAIDIKPDASFVDNAKLILNIDPKTDQFLPTPNPNSFQSTLETMHNKGYAATRVDYVAHSMGGVVGRTAISNFQAYYLTTLAYKYFYKNYRKGFVNKFITIQTPHNGSPIANIAFEMPMKRRGFLLKEAQEFATSAYKFNGYDSKGMEIYDVTNAIRDLRAKKGFSIPETYVKNHLIGTQIMDDQISGDNLVEKSLDLMRISSELSAYYGFLAAFSNLPIIGTALKIFKVDPLAIEIYSSALSGNIPHFPNSDGVVGMKSQLAGKSKNDRGVSKEFFGIEYHHLASRDSIEIGNKVFELLNYKMNDWAFASTIPANGSSSSPNSIEVQDNIEENDSIIYRHDTGFIKITNPERANSLIMDSLMVVSISVDTSKPIKDIELLFQKNIFLSNSKAPIQNFNVQVDPRHPGSSVLFAFATVDSANYSINYFDTLRIYTVNHNDSNFSFSIYPHIQWLLPGSRYFLPEFLKRQDEAITYIKADDSLIVSTVLDSNVAVVDRFGYIQAKDTGSTQIIYTYKGQSDTLIVLIDAGSPAIILEHPANSNLCPQDDRFFVAKGQSGSTYQWQLDSGNGYTNLTNNGFYKGVTKDTLWLNQPPTSMAGYRYRCLITNSKGSTYTLPAFLRFSTTWTGTADSAWDNSGNWSCGMVPDEFTDVTVPEKTNIPKISSDVKCRSLLVSPGSTIQIQPGKKLEVNGKDWDFQY